MNNLIDVQPTDIVRRDNSFIFFYGVKARDIYQLPGKAEFSVVYSPADRREWEFVRYQVFANANGAVVLERRLLNADEIAYFKLLISNLKSWRMKRGG